MEVKTSQQAKWLEQTTTERLTRIETTLELLMNNHMHHVEMRLKRLETGMIGVLCFAISNLLLLVYQLWL